MTLSQPYKWALRAPVFRIYGDEYGEFRGIWFQWPIYKRYRMTFNDTVGLKIDMMDIAEMRAALSESWRDLFTGKIIVPEKFEGLTVENFEFPDVTPREPYTHAWIEDGCHCGACHAAGFCAGD